MGCASSKPEVLVADVHSDVAKTAPPWQAAGNAAAADATPVKTLDTHCSVNTDKQPHIAGKAATATVMPLVPSNRMPASAPKSLTDQQQQQLPRNGTSPDTATMTGDQQQQQESLLAEQQLLRQRRSSNGGQAKRAHFAPLLVTEAAAAPASVTSSPQQAARQQQVPTPAPRPPPSVSLRGGAGGGGSSGVQVLRSGGARGAKLRERRGGISSSFHQLQGALTTDAEAISVVSTRAAGLKHIGFGPFKRENQDEFFIQIGQYGNQPGGSLFCVFDGHGAHGKDAAAYSRQVLPALLDGELRKFFTRNANAAEPSAADTTKGAVEVLITEVFSETEKSLTRAGVNLASSGTTASVVFQLGSRLWIASAGDSRVILCQRLPGDRGKWRSQPLTIDHRPRRLSERERVEAAGARVQPKRLPSGRMVGEPRLWLQEVSSPGLLVSRSLGDLMAATVGCTSDPEITYVTLTTGRDQFVVLATDGVWDVLTNEQVCDIVVESPDPHIACRRVLDAALYEWEERMSADNITVLVIEFDWGSGFDPRGYDPHNEELLAMAPEAEWEAYAAAAEASAPAAARGGGAGPRVTVAQQTARPPGAAAVLVPA